MKVKMIAVVTAMLLGACAPKTVWIVPGEGTQEEKSARYEKDRRECIYEGKRAAGPMGGGDIMWAAYMSNQLAVDCMVSRGYAPER